MSKEQDDIITTAKTAKMEIAGLFAKIVGLQEHAFTCDLLHDAMGECDYIIKCAKRGWAVNHKPVSEE
jgi:hypothetical protein